MVKIKYIGQDYMCVDTYKVVGKEAYVKYVGGGYYLASPSNDPDGEPDRLFKDSAIEVVEGKPKRRDKTREEKKLILATMIASNQYKEGKSSVEWVDFASSIKNLELTKELLKELREEPYEMAWEPERGWFRVYR